MPLNEIKNGGLKLGLEMRPEILMIDFEHAAMNAFSYHFLRIQIKCCFFLLGQTFYRKLCSERTIQKPCWSEKIRYKSNLFGFGDVSLELILEMHQTFDLEGEN